MFYSHQLLARKAPLGQIWMAATMHAKINRRNLDKLNIIQICEEILNPSVPMALRLSGILMGGVVIVYERKVKLLYDDVTRLVVQINEAWKVKTVADPTVLLKGKTQARYEAVTLPDQHVDVEVERAVHFSDASLTNARLQRMRLEDLDEIYININPGDDDGLQQRFHQADAANITLVDDFRSVLAETELANRFERFDIDGDDESHMNFSTMEQPQTTFTVIPSPPRPDEHPKTPINPQSSQPRYEAPLPEDVPMPDQMEGQEEQQAKELSNEDPEAEVATEIHKPYRRRVRRNLADVIMDTDQTMIPASVYHSWIQDASNTIPRRGRLSRTRNGAIATKISELMDLPPLALINGGRNFPAEVHYPPPLLKQWKKCTAHTRGSPSSGEHSARSIPENPSSHSLPEGLQAPSPPEFPPEDYSHVGSHRADSIEMVRNQLENMGFPAVNEVLLNGDGVTPATTGKQTSFVPSSGSGHDFDLLRQEMRAPLTRSKRRQQSSGRGSADSLDPVEEEISFEQNGKGPKLTKLAEDVPNADFDRLTDLLEETGPTQTPLRKVYDTSFDQITQSIRKHLKSHFESRDAPQYESLEQLAFGMNRKKAAQFFYQTCVLATHDFVKVKQTAPYADILISRGPEM